MSLRPWRISLALALIAGPLPAQDSVRDLHEAGQQGKFLTPNQIDRWLFEGDAGETIIAHVASKEFDPILELAKRDSKDDKPLLEVDDPGNESRFAMRLPEKGKYEIRVHAYKHQGGGNYALRIQRFQAKPLTVGTPLVGVCARDGRSHFHFDGVKDRILVPELKGVPSEAWRALDAKGREVRGWAGTIPLEQDGVAYLTVAGQPGQRFDVTVREARRFDLPERKAQAGSLRPGEAEVWSFSGKPGDFRLLEVEKKGEVLARLIHAPPAKEEAQSLGRPGDRPEIEFLPVASRRGWLRFAVVLGREGRYQLQLVAASSASYELTMGDPSVPIASGRDVEGTLPVGGAAFYSFRATPGQLLQAGLTTAAFVPVLRLYDDRGALVAGSAGDSDALVGRVSHMMVNEGTYRLQVSSAGDGGGGAFRQSLKDATVEELKVGERGKGMLQSGATDFRAFEGEEGRTVFLSVRSSAFEPAVSLRGPDGVGLVADEKGSDAVGSLLAVKLPKTGRYTVWIAARRGEGEYTVRLIDGD